MRIFWEQIKFQLRENKKLRGGRYWMGNIDKGEGQALYQLIRETKPNIVVETGCANGISTYYILAALHKNRHGKLYTIDLPQYKNNIDSFPHSPNKTTFTVVPDGRQPGWIVPKRLRNRWHLIIGSSKEKLPELLEKLGKVDVFMHDSDHHYEYIKWELNTVEPYVVEEGFFLIDDFKRNNACNEFCDQYGYVSKWVNGMMIIKKGKTWGGF